jgi:hypothetical protein
VLGRCPVSVSVRIPHTLDRCFVDSFSVLQQIVGQDSSVGIATRYWMDCPGIWIRPIPVAERSKARVCDRSLAGVPGLNPAGGMDVCVVCVAQPGQSGQRSNTENKNSRWGRDFPHLSRPALESTQPPVQWVPGSFPGSKAAETWLWPHTQINSMVKGRLEVDLYFPCGPSWPLIN